MSVNEIDLHLSNSACPEKHLLSSVNQVILKISIPEQTLTVSKLHAYFMFRHPGVFVSEKRAVVFFFFFEVNVTKVID